MTVSFGGQALALLLAVLPQGFSNPRIVDPSEHLSPDGEYVLAIDPSQPYGNGPAHYHLRRGDETAWKGELAFTLTELEVLDSGYVVGYSEVRSMGSLVQDLVVAIVAPDGRLVLEEHLERVPSRYPDGSDTPIPLGLIVDPERDRLAVRIADADLNRGHESWMRYLISSGVRREDLVPEAVMPEFEQFGRRLVTAEPLRGADLLLLHWWTMDFRYDYDSGEYAAESGTFTLVRESDAAIVWSLELPHDYTISGDEQADDALAERVRDHGAILGSGPGASFSLWHVEDGQRVTYTVEEDPESENGWRVEERERVAFDVPEPVEPAPRADVPVVPLVALEPVGLAVQGDPVPDLGQVVAYDLGQGGSFYSIRLDPLTGVYTHVEWDATGATLAEREFASFRRAEGHYGEWFHEAGSKWLVTDQSWEDDGHLVLYRADADTGLVEPLPDFTAPTIGAVALDVEDLACAPDGGFVVLGMFYLGYTVPSVLFAFDARGALRWAITEDYEDPAKLFSPESVAVAADGRVVVLDNIRKALQVYGSDGAHHTNVDLEEVWGVELNYPSSISAGPDGVLLIHDFGGRPPLWVVDIDGTPRLQFAPKFADGREPDDLPRSTRFAPDGSLWTFDGYGFLRLGDAGLVEQRVGPEARSNAIYELGPRAVIRGRICAQDRRTGSLHVWDETGKLQLFGAAEPGDADAVPAGGGVHEAPDGSLWVPTEGRGRLGWAADGTRLGVTEFEPPLARSPDGQHVVRREGAALRIEGPAGELAGKIERQPDNRWLRSIGDVEYLPDGNLGVLHEPTPTWAPSGPGGELLVYSPAGAPLRRIELGASHDGRMEVSGRWLVMPGEADVVLFGLISEETFRFELEQGDEHSEWSHGLSADGQRLLSFDSTAMVVYRHQLP